MPLSRHVTVDRNRGISNTRHEPALLLNQSTDTTSQSTAGTLSSRALLGSISSGLGGGAGGLSWAPLDGGYRTTQSGGTFSIKFFGQSLIWYGFYDTSFPWAAPGTGPMAFYTIDQVDTFAFSTVPSSVTTQPKSTLSNLPLFETKTLPLGQHLLEVSFLGGSGNVPLTVVNIAVSDQAGGVPSPSSPSPSVGGGASSLIVSRSPSSAVTSAAPSSAVSPPDSASSATPSSSSSPSSSTNATASVTGSDSASLSQPPPSASPLQVTPGTTAVASGPSSSALTNTGPGSDLNSSAPATKKANVGAIAGGIAAGVVVLLIIFVLLFLRRRRKRTRDAAGAALGSSSSLRVGAGGESGTGQGMGAGSIVPDPFPATRQLDLSPVTLSRPYDNSGANGASSEKARMYLEQQMLLADPLSADWPQPMNAKHRDARPPEATQTPSISHLPGAAVHGDSDSPIRSPSAMGSAFTSSSSSPRPPASQSLPRIPAPVPTHVPAQPPVGIPRVMGAVQDEDSGIRLMQHSDTGGFVEVLPPSYTAH